MSRKTISVSEHVYSLLKAQKGVDESFNDLLERLVQVHEDGGAEGADGLPDDVLTEEHIDDIVAQASRKTADELENRLRGR